MFPEIDGSNVVKPGMTNLRVLALDDNPLLGLDEVRSLCMCTRVAVFKHSSYNRQHTCCRLKALKLPSLSTQDVHVGARSRW